MLDGQVTASDPVSHSNLTLTFPQRHGSAQPDLEGPEAELHEPQGRLLPELGQPGGEEEALAADCR